MRNHDVIVVGGGPIGLYAAQVLSKKGIDFMLLEAEKSLGGQPRNLYPEKMVDDVELVSVRAAKDVISAFSRGIDPEKIKISSPVVSLAENKNEVFVKTAEQEYRSKFVILATGLGFQKPRTLGLTNEGKCANILYALKDPSAMSNKKIVIFGGGDSALDWAKALSKISPFVSLVHRRMEFRGDPKTIDGCKLAIYLPYVPEYLTEKEGFCKDITIKNVNDDALLTLSCDYVLVNYGQVPSPSTFALPLSQMGFGIVVKADQVVTERIYAVGDCAYSPTKKKRIQPGIEETDSAIISLERCLRAK
jgi:thioredoxin reductase (NADPH)